jgi:hypothetical protein
MDAILAQRYAFCDFSNIVGFPHPVPTIAEWDDYLPRFRGRKHDHPGEHLLNFHKCMLEHDFFHEDVLIKMFRFSLEEHAREWCQSLPAASIHSLKDFYVAFKQRYSVDLLFEECCMGFEVQDVCNQEMVKEEIVPRDPQQVSHGFRNHVLSQEIEIEANNQISAVNFSDCYESEDMSAPIINHENQFSSCQIALEILKDNGKILQQPCVFLDKENIEEIQGQLISYSSPTIEKLSPGINKPASFIFEPESATNIRYMINSDISLQSISFEKQREVLFSQYTLETYFHLELFSLNYYAF